MDMDELVERWADKLKSDYSDLCFVHKIDFKDYKNSISINYMKYLQINPPTC